MNLKNILNFFNTHHITGSTEDSDISKIQPKHSEKLSIILDRLDISKSPYDMNFYNSKLHPLKGDRKGEWAVTVRDNWRITFKFKEQDVIEVNYEDYHKK
jgi:toxin HigB-1